MDGGKRSLNRLGWARRLFFMTLFASYLTQSGCGARDDRSDRRTVSRRAAAEHGDTTLQGVRIEPQSLSVDNPEPVIGIGELTHVAVFGNHPQHGRVPLAGRNIVWTNDAPSIVATAGFPFFGLSNRLLIKGSQIGTATITATYEGLSIDVQVRVIEKALLRLEVSPSTTTMPLGSTRAFLARAIFSDGSTADYSNRATWSSTNQAVATVGSDGVATARAIGNAIVTARIGAAVGRASVAVTDVAVARIEIDPARISVALGDTQQLRATAILSDGTTRDVTGAVEWKARPYDVASFDTSTLGLVLGKKIGTGSISAKLRGGNGQVSTATVALTVTEARLVSLTVDPPAVSVPKGLSVALRATGLYSDGTTRNLSSSVVWSVEDENIASILPYSISSPEEALTTAVQLHGIAVGHSKAYAATDSVRAEFDVVVTEATVVSVEVTARRQTIPVGFTEQLSATARLSDGSARDVTTTSTWTSTRPRLIPVGDAPGTKGLVQAVASGKAVISVTTDTGHSARLKVVAKTLGITSISVNPVAPSLAAGRALPFAATAVFGDGTVRDVTQDVTWSTGEPAIATISNAIGSRGVAQSAGPGDTYINASKVDQVSQNVFEGRTALHVTPAELVGIELSPSMIRLPVGTATSLKVTGLYSNATKVDVTMDAFFSVSDAAIIQVINSGPQIGRLEALAPGQASIRAQVGSFQASVDVEVTRPVVVGLELSPILASLPQGLTQQFSAFAQYEDGRSVEVTDAVTWQAEPAEFGTIGATTPNFGLFTALAVGEVRITARFETIGASIEASQSIRIISPVLTAVEIVPETIRMPVETSQRLRAFGVFSDQSRQDVTEAALWISGQPGIVDVSNREGERGLVTALAEGTVPITATWQGISGLAEAQAIAAQLATIDVTPAQVALAAGLTQSFRAMGTYSNGTSSEVTREVVWNSTAPEVLSIRNNHDDAGLGQALSVGATTVTATIGDVSGAAQVTVTNTRLTAIEIAPGQADIPAGLSVTFAAIGHYSDQSTRPLDQAAVLWSIADTNIATVTNAPPVPGTVTAIAPGISTLAATSGSISARIPITVSEAVPVRVELELARDELPLGTRGLAHLQAIYSDGRSRDVTAAATFTSNAPDVATISIVEPTVVEIRSHATGRALIGASFAELTAASTVTVTEATVASVEVVAPKSRIPLSLPRNLQAVATFTDGSTVDVTTQAVFGQADADILSVSNLPESIGLLTPFNVGSTEVTARFESVVGRITITIDDTVLTTMVVEPDRATVHYRESQRLHASGVYSNGDVFDLTTVATWTSGDGSIVTVSNAPGTAGEITGRRRGTTGVRALKDGVGGGTTVVVVADLARLALTPPRQSIAVGETAQIIATATYEDGSVDDATGFASWTAEPSDLATVSLGQVTGRASGDMTVRARLETLESTLTLSIAPPRLVSLAFEPASIQVPKGLSRPLTLLATYSDGSFLHPVADVTLSPVDSTIVTIEGGTSLTVRGLNEGSTSITATFGALNATLAVTVIAPVMQSLAMSPPAATIAKGRTTRFMAVATMSDGTITESPAAVFASSAIDVGTIDETGLARGISEGSCIIAATAGGLTAQASLTVTAAELASLLVAPDELVLPNGTTATFTARGLYSDGSTLPLPAPVTWTTSDQLIASIDSNGTVQAHAVGNAEITAHYLTMASAPVHVQVTGAQITALTIAPTAATVPLGRQVRFTATAWYSDQTIADVTPLTLWGTLDPQIATIAADGLASTLDIGATVVTGTFLGLTTTASLSVTTRSLDDLIASPPTVELAVGQSVDLHLSGRYSDGTIETIVENIEWESSQPQVAAVNPSSGHLQALSPGPAVVTARFGSLSVNVNTTVTERVIETLILTPTAARLLRGESLHLMLVARYSDQSEEDVTRATQWTVDNSDVAAVDGSGILQALSFGSVIVTGSVGQLSATMTVTVSAGAAFAELCRDLDLPAATRHTIAALLTVAATQDCQQAEAYFAAANSLDLANQAITDLSPLAPLAAVRWLVLDGNQVQDLSPLASLAQLRGLYLDDNLVEDLAALSGLSLTHLSLDGNPIASLAPLEAMSTLRTLSINNIPDLDVSSLTQLDGLVGLLADGADGTYVLSNGPLGQLKALAIGQSALLDASPLVEAQHLQWVSIKANLISDVSALAYLPSLLAATIAPNPITRDQAHCPVAATRDPVSQFCSSYLFDRPTSISPILGAE